MKRILPLVVLIFIKSVINAQSSSNEEIKVVARCINKYETIPDCGDKKVASYFEFKIEKDSSNVLKGKNILGIVPCPNSYGINFYNTKQTGPSPIKVEIYLTKKLSEIKEYELYNTDLRGKVNGSTMVRTSGL